MANRKQAKEADIKFSQEMATPAAPAETPAKPAAPKVQPISPVLGGAARAEREAKKPVHPRAALDQEKMRQASPANIERLKRQNEMVRGIDGSRMPGQAEAEKRGSRYSEAERQEANKRAAAKQEEYRLEELKKYNETPVSEKEKKTASKISARLVKPKTTKDPKPKEGSKGYAVTGDWSLWKPGKKDPKISRKGRK